MQPHILAVVLLFACSNWDHSSAAPATASNGQSLEREVSNEVQQLDQLRRETAAKQQASAGAHVQSTSGVSQIKSNGGPSAPARPVEPPKGSTIFRHHGETKKSNLAWDATKRMDMDRYAKFDGVQYTPADLADYIFRTGDEEGVALAVEELVREGMMGRTDAINYLQDVKETLMYMKDQYERAWRLQEMRKNFPKSLPSGQKPLSVAQNMGLIPIPDSQKRASVTDSQSVKTTAAATEGHQAPPASTSAPEGTNRLQPSTQSTADTEREDNALFREQQKEALNKLERLRAVNSFYDEFTLEEVIYQLAKDMFAQSMARGDQTAEDTLTRLIGFLESEVDNKRISGEMREKVLEIVSAALVDSLREYPGLLTPDRRLEMKRSGYTRGSAKGMLGTNLTQPNTSPKTKTPVAGGNQQQASGSVSQNSSNPPETTSDDKGPRLQPNVSNQRA